MRLKSREKFIPNGFVYYVPQIPLWRPQANSSLDSLSQQVLTLRQANPFLTQKHGWSLDLNAILNELDEYNATWCAQNGWDAYISGAGGSPPIPKSSQQTAHELSQLSAAAKKAKQIWAGVKTLNEWLDSGDKGVPKEQAETRAQVCIACPLNGKGDLTRWFTIPAAGAIKRQLQKLTAMDLKVSVEDQLGVCEGCSCPNKLKVWTPMKFIKPHLSDDTLDELRKGKDCWIVAELAQA